MNNGQAGEISPLFLVRLWRRGKGDIGNEKDAVSAGKVLNVVTGEAHYFRDWADLTATLQEMAPLERPGSQSTAQILAALPAPDDGPVAALSFSPPGATSPDK